MGTGPSDYLQIIAEPSQRAPVTAAIFSFLSDQTDIDLLDLHQIRRETPEPGEIEQATCLAVDLPSTYEAYVEGLSKSLRYDVRRLDRKEFRDGSARFVIPDDPRLAMDTLFEQHIKRWKSRGLPGAFLGRAHSFHHQWAARALERGWLRVSILEHEGQPIGAIYAMTLHGVCYYYQAGFDPAASTLSPGTLLVAQTIRSAINEGVHTFDFCRGDEPYKRRWKPQHVYTNVRLVLPTGTGIGRAGLGRLGGSWNRWAWGVESKVRAKLEGGSLKIGSNRPKKPEKGTVSP